MLLDLSGFEVKKWGDSWRRQRRDYRGRWTDMPDKRVARFDFDAFHEEYSRVTAPRGKKPATRAPKTKAKAPKTKVGQPSKVPPVKSTPRTPSSTRKPPTKAPIKSTPPEALKPTPKPAKVVNPAPAPGPKRTTPDEAVRDALRVTRGLDEAHRQSVAKAVRKMTETYQRPVKTDHIGPVGSNRELIDYAVTFAFSPKTAAVTGGFYTKEQKLTAQKAGAENVTSTEMIINDNVLKDPEGFKARTHSSAHDGYSIDIGTGDAFEYLIAHEYAHTLHAGLTAEESDKFYREMKKKLGYELKDYTDKNKKQALGVSVYATSDEEEDMAELIAESMALHAYKPGTNWLADTIATTFKEVTS